jgi:hypothetical protein
MNRQVTSQNINLPSVNHCGYDQSKLKYGLYVVPCNYGFPFHYTRPFQIEISVPRYKQGTLKSVFDIRMPDNSSFSGVAVVWDELSQYWRPDLGACRPMLSLSDEEHSEFPSGMPVSEVIAKLSNMRFPRLCETQRRKVL